MRDRDLDGKDISYRDFVCEIKRRTGIDLTLYKQEQMMRRLRGSMERSGASDYASYLRLLDSDATARQVFLDRLTINVSELFRNPDHFEVLAGKVLPQLKCSSSTIKVWSAGCSFGAEPVSLSILIRERCPGIAFEILASDIDEGILKTAARGVFCEADLKNVSPERRARWFVCTGEEWQVRSEVLRRISFLKHNLLADCSPGMFDLIVCRNVVIYFTDEAKGRVNALFHQSLKPGGYLFIGGTERVAGYEEIGFANPMAFFYQKAA